MTLRDEVHKAVVDLSPTELSERLASAGLMIVKRLPEYSDEEWRERMLDYHFNHNVESKRKRAIELICQAVGIETREERAAELVERQLNAPEPTACKRFWERWLTPIIVGVILLILGYFLPQILGSMTDVRN